METLKESATKLRWLNNLTMQLIWPNQQKDLIFLTEMGNHFCEFSGNFEHKFQACPNGRLVQRWPKAIGVGASVFSKMLNALGHMVFGDA